MGVSETTMEMCGTAVGKLEQYNLIQTEIILIQYRIRT